jgi:YgiT-type zinc finger domain-containing protein
MKCLHCQGQLQRGFTDFQVTRKGYHLTLDRVPAWVCRQCGEGVFDEEQTTALQGMLESLDHKTEDLAVAK